MPSSERHEILIEAVNNASKTLQAVQKDLNKITDEFKDVGEQAKKTEDMSKDVFKGVFGAELAIGVLRQLGDTITDLVSSAVTEFARFEQTQVAFETMIGNTQEAQFFLQELNDFAATTPFTIQGVEDSSRLLLAMGIEVQDLLPTLGNLGDVAAGLSVPIDQLALAFGQVKAAGRLTGQELRQFTNAGVPLLKVLSDELGTTEAAIKKMTETGEISFKDVEKAFESMSGEGGRFFDLMDKQSETLAGRWSNLQDSTTQLGRKFGEILSPALDELLDVGADLLAWAEELILTSDNKLKPEVVELSQKFGELVKDIRVTAEFAIPILVKAFKVVAFFFKPLITGFKALSISIGGWVEAMSAASTAVPVFWGNIIDNLEIARDNIFQIMKNIAFNIVAGVTPGLEPRDIASNLTGFLPIVSNDIIGATNAIKDIFTETLDDIQDIWSSTSIEMPDLTSEFEGYSTAAESAFSDVAESAKGAEVAAEDIEGAMEGLQDAVADLDDVYAGFEDSVVDALASVLEETSNALSEIESEMQDIFTSMEQATADFLSAQGEDNVSLATAFVDQEALVADLEKDYQNALDAFNDIIRDGEVGTDAYFNASADLTSISDQLSTEQDALESFAERAIEIENEIAEARRLAGLTDFERTIEEIDTAAALREDEFNTAMEMYASQLLALEDQKEEIKRLEEEAVASISLLADRGGLIYETFMNRLTSLTEDTVGDLEVLFAEIERMMSNAELVGEAVGLIENNVGDVTLNADPTTGSSSTTTTVGTINIEINELPADATSADLADTITEEILRQLTLEAQGV